MEAERAERTLIKEEAAAKDRRNFEWMQQLRREGFRKVRAARHMDFVLHYACLPCRWLVAVHECRRHVHDALDM
jgi:hypothetical protein